MLLNVAVYGNASIIRTIRLLGFAAKVVNQCIDAQRVGPFGTIRQHGQSVSASVHPIDF
jgi:hypothetical protein